MRLMWPFGNRLPEVVAFDIIDTTFQIEPLDDKLVRLGLPLASYRRLYAAGHLVAHPNGQFPKRAVALCDEQQVNTVPGCALTDRQLLTMQRMPRICDPRPPQTVC